MLTDEQKEQIQNMIDTNFLIIENQISDVLDLFIKYGHRFVEISERLNMLSERVSFLAARTTQNTRDGYDD